MPAQSRSTPSGLSRELHWAIATLVAVVLVASLGALMFLIDVRAPTVSMLGISALLVAAVGGVAAGVVFKLRRGVELPVEDLARTTRAVVAGDLSKPATEEGPDELADIAQALNRLGRELATERQRLRQMEKLADAGRLAAGIANEISHPLAGITNAVEQCRSREMPPEERATLLDRIADEAERARRTAHGLIDLAKPRSMVPVRLDVNEAARTAARLVTERGAVHQRRVVLLLDASEPIIHGNKHDLEQVLLNLLLNAADATPPQGKIVVATHRMARVKVEEGIVRRANDPPLTIRSRRDTPRIREWLTRVRPPAEVVSLVVADSGRGIPHEDWDRVFEPFFTTKPPGEGTGLGLSVVSNIVESLNGTVWVEKAREGGAAFHLLFPVAVGAKPAALVSSRVTVSASGAL